MIEASDDGIRLASSLLIDGKLVAFPTETVYGLGAHALDEKAVISIFKAKGRPFTDPVIVHVLDLNTALPLIEVTEEENIIFQSLGSAFWPGPLTMIVKAGKMIPLKVTANTGFVGIRCPSHNIARQLLTKANIPIAAPSANRFGHVSPTKPEHVLADLGHQGVTVLKPVEINDDSSSCYDNNNNECEYGIESTVIKIDAYNKSINILRQGAVTKHQIETILKKENILWSVEVTQRIVPMPGTINGSDEYKTENDENNKDEEECGEQAPGQSITHYAPDIPCFKVGTIKYEIDKSNIDHFNDNDSIMISYPEKLFKQTVVGIDFNGSLSKLTTSVLDYRDLSSQGNASEAARNLFEFLRWAENVEGVKTVFIAPVDSALEQDLGPGLFDRILRATSGKTVHALISS